MTYRLVKNVKTHRIHEDTLAVFLFDVTRSMAQAARDLPDFRQTSADYGGESGVALFGTDQALVELLRRRGACSVSQIARELQVTLTAIRQRLMRLQSQGFVARKAAKAARGRPAHHYELTDKALRKTGNNFADLSVALWDELREIRDVEVRNGLLKRLAGRLAAYYAPAVSGASVVERMESIARLFSERNIPFESQSVTKTESLTPGHQDTIEDARLPVLNNDASALVAWACPYPQLAEQDRGICAVENMVLTELVGSRVKLASCRLDGDPCCRFQTT